MLMSAHRVVLRPVSLCGHWDHEGPCRWPHYSTLEPRADGLSKLVVDFNAVPQDVERVRAKIKAGVETGQLVGPDGRLSKWRTYRTEGFPLKGDHG